MSEEKKIEEQPKIEAIRQATSAVGEVAAFLNQKIVESIGKLEYFERAKVAGATEIPAYLTDYERAKLHDLHVLRDALTSVFFYKRLDSEEIDLIKSKVEEAKKAAEDKA
jgi:hypothetical protein